ncbi:MAG: PilZ domain-containing protein [Bacillota bacterium]
MVSIQDKRKYQTSNGTICAASVSHDGIRWREVEVADISPVGLKFYSTKVYNTGEILNFDLCVYSMLSEFNLTVEGCITDRETLTEGYCYGVKFNNVEEHVKIQLDEIIKANIISKNAHEAGDGIYSFILTPRGKTNKY